MYELYMDGVLVGTISLAELEHRYSEFVESGIEIVGPPIPWEGVDDGNPVPF